MIHPCRFGTRDNTCTMGKALSCSIAANALHLCTAAKPIPTRQEFAEAKKTLTAAGWEKSLSVMSDEGDTNSRYGTLFIKPMSGGNSIRFWLNKASIDFLPE
jgi:hypothetical protein